jgi:DNA modification methylase/superfamily II DNA or RNA helicase
MKDNLQEFINSKRIKAQFYGKNIKPNKVHPLLKPFQRDVVIWALRKGRAAMFLDTGLGKTYCQLEWARLTGENTLIIAPLSVARQTMRMAKDIDVNVKYVRHQSECDQQLCITNYEMLDEFDPSKFGAVVLDESSILKSLDGRTKEKLLSMFGETPYRLACTATPAPNDETEIGNHAEFLGVCTTNQMKSMFFINANRVTEIQVGDGRIVNKKQRGSNGQEWRIRNYARNSFYEWMTSWSISIKKPSDLGYSDEGYNLPELKIIPSFVDVDYKPADQLFFTGLSGIQERHTVRTVTLEARVKIAADMVNNSKDQWIVWCGLTAEGDALADAISDSVQVKGSDDIEHKIKTIQEFQDKKIRVLVTKPKIAGFGMNFQNAHNMVFVGLSDSWESYYQCIRREWRFGQKKPVNAYIVLSEVEREIYANVMQKEAIAKRMSDELIARLKTYEKDEIMNKEIVKSDYKEKTTHGRNFTAMLGDSCQRLAEIADESIDLSVYSPPFADLFTYSASEYDLGNSKDWREFFVHYAFIIQELLRVTKSGRLTCVHTADIAAMSMKDGYMGLRDFPGAVVQAYEKEGWVFFGRAVVPKNPQSQAIRTKAHALLFATLKKDSSRSRPAINDQVLIFQKEGESEVPVTPVSNGEIDNERWIDWAGGIWSGISESDTLQYTTARAVDDEKHICPLQLGTIERCIKLYSNPGETVLTPFMGIGSEAYQALKFGRKAIGIELKESYYNIAIQNLSNVESVMSRDLFSYIDQEVQE